MALVDGAVTSSGGGGGDRSAVVPGARSSMIQDTVTRTFPDRIVGARAGLDLCCAYPQLTSQPPASALQRCRFSCVLADLFSIYFTKSYTE